MALTSERPEKQPENGDPDLLPVMQIDSHHDDDQHNTGPMNCCHKVLTPDVKKLIHQMFQLAWAVVVGNLFTFLVNTQSILFCGHLGATELAAGSLSNTIVMIFGLSIAVGMASALDTLCSQAYGAKNFKMVGAVLQRGILILAIAGVFVCGLWLVIQHFLLLIGFESHIAKMADMFMITMLPMIPPEFCSQLLIKYLHNQGIVRPIVLVGFLTNLFAFGLNYLIIIHMELGFRGVPIALMLASYVRVVLIVSYILITKVHKKTWTGWSADGLRDWKQFLSLSLPGMLMICMEWWTFEIMTFVLGVFGETPVAAHGVLLQISLLAFMLPFGVSMSASILVGSFLGANDIKHAKLVTKISLMMALFITALFSMLFVICRRYIAMAFSNNENVINLILDLTPLVAFFLFLDSTQGVSAGILRGCGQQKVGMLINFVCHELIAIPLGVVLGVVMNLQLKGVWYGISAGIFVQAASYVVVVLSTNWKRQAELAMKRTSKGHKLKPPKTSSDLNGKEDHYELKETTNGYIVEDGKEKQHEEDVCPAANDLVVRNVALSSETINSDDDLVVENVTHSLGKTSIKKLILLRSIPFLIAVLFLCVAICIRFLVPLPTAYVRTHNSGNQTNSATNGTFANRTVNL